MRLADFGDLTKAEHAVIDGLGTGHVTVLGDGTLPSEDAGDDRRVRASLIRWLALGAPGDDQVRLHENGLRIAGALVVSDGQADPMVVGSTAGLKLGGCTLDHDLVLANCRFRDAPAMLGAKLETLNLQGAHLPGLQADRLEARGGVFLRGVKATGEVRLSGARIGGDLSCIGGRFETERGTPLNADGLKAQGGVFLRDVHATGPVRLLGVRIGGNLDCEGGRFETTGGEALNAGGLEARGYVFLRGVHAKGEVRLLNARIGGNLECDEGRFENPDGLALNADSARVTGTFFWREESHADGRLDLTSAEIGHICDDPGCWPKAGDLLLHRCRYGAFTGLGINAEDRIKWLDLQDPSRFGHDFWPQPWEHCAQVLREMGHPEDARQVLIEKEKRQRAAGLARLRREVAGSWQHARIPLRIARDWLLAVLIAYGHRPLRALWWLAGMWAFGAMLFAWAHVYGGFKPNNAFILRSAEWAQCVDGGDRRGDHPSTLDCYLAQPEAAGYPVFNAAFYSLDTLVPVVDLEVQDYWVPDEKVAGWARVYLWAHIGMGWFLALLAVAGFSGLVQTRATSE